MQSNHDTVIDRSQATVVERPKDATVVERPFPATVIERRIQSGIGRAYHPPALAWHQRLRWFRRLTAAQLKMLIGSGVLLFVVSVYAIAVVGNDTAVGAITDKSVILVKTAQVQERLTAEPVHGTGVLTARREMPLSFKTAGLLRVIDVEEGDFVRAGTLLAALDSSEAVAQMRQTGAAVAKTNRDYARVKALIQANALPLQVMQDARTQQALASAALKVAELNERYTRIIAPADGVITKRLRNANELVPAGAAVVEFAATESGWVVRTGIADRDVLRLKVGDTAHVELGGFADKSFGGRVTGIAAKATAATGTFDVEVEVNPGSAAFLSGLVAKVDLEPAAAAALVAIPIEALLGGDGRRGYVFVLGDDGVHVRKVAVNIAFIDDPSVALSDGVAAGQLVITDGAAYLKDGAAVRLPDPTVANL